MSKELSDTISIIMIDANKNIFNSRHLILARPVLIIVSLVLAIMTIVTVMTATTEIASAQTCYINGGVVDCPTDVGSGCWTIPVSSQGAGEPYETDCPAVCYTNSVDEEVVECPVDTGSGCWVIPKAGPHGAGTPFKFTCPGDTTTADGGFVCDKEVYSDEECESLAAGRYEQPDTSTGETCGDVPVSIGVDCDPDINPIYSYIVAAINFLSAGVGIVVIIMVSIGGVQYMMAGGNPQSTQAAIMKISNALIALVLFIFTWAFLNWLVPGGMF